MLNSESRLYQSSTFFFLFRFPPNDIFLFEKCLRPTPSFPSCNNYDRSLGEKYERDDVDLMLHDVPHRDPLRATIVFRKEQYFSSIDGLLKLILQTGRISVQAL